MRHHEESVGALIRRLRDLRGISQTELADRVHMPRATLAGIETGRIDQPDRDRLEAIAEVLLVDPRLLLQAAGYRVRGEPSPIRERTLADILEEAAKKARELEGRDDSDAKSQLADAFRFVKKVVYAQPVLSLQ